MTRWRKYVMSLDTPQSTKTKQSVAHWTPAREHRMWLCIILLHVQLHLFVDAIIQFVMLFRPLGDCEGVRAALHQKIHELPLGSNRSHLFCTVT